MLWTETIGVLRSGTDRVGMWQTAAADRERLAHLLLDTILERLQFFPNLIPRVPVAGLLFTNGIQSRDESRALITPRA